MPSFSIVNAVLTQANAVAFISYGSRGTRDIDNLSDYDPYYKKEDVIGQSANAGQQSQYKADLSFSPNRGMIAYKDDVSRYMLFQFNPEEIQDEKTINYEDSGKTGVDNTDFFWVNGGPRTVSFTLQMDATEGSRQSHLGQIGGATLSQAEKFTHDPARGVLNQVEFLQALTRPLRQDPNAPVFVRGSVAAFDQFQAPPEIVFVYGYFYLEGVVLSVTPTYTLWNRDLVPVRANVAVQLRIQEGQTIKVSPELTNVSTQGFNLNR